MTLHDKYHHIQQAQHAAEQVADPDRRRMLLQLVAIGRVIVVAEEVNRVLAA